jgi:hypothetical protein
MERVNKLLSVLLCQRRIFKGVSIRAQRRRRVFSCWAGWGRLCRMSKRKARYQAPEGSLRAALEHLPDVRRGQGLEHPLGGVLALAVCAVLCGARSQYAVSQWGQDCGEDDSRRLRDQAGAWS